MSYVYRRPLQTSQHLAARVVWQTQPLWAFTGLSDYLELTENIGTIGFYTANPFVGLPDPLELTENTGTLGFMVPYVVPMSESSARFLIQSVAGFIVTTTHYSDPYVAFGDVISTNPSGGTFAPYGSTVQMTVSIGTQAPGEHGAGYPVGWQGKRKKPTLKQQPNKHLKKLLDDVGVEVLKKHPQPTKTPIGKKAIKLWP